MGCTQSAEIYPYVNPKVQNGLEDQRKIYQSQICFKCGWQNQNLFQLNCGHSYHMECLIQWRIQQRLCICNDPKGKLTQIHEFVYKLVLKKQVRIIPQEYENQKEKEKKQDYKFIFCSGSMCNFFFIYDAKLNIKSSKEYYCDQCNRMRQYDKEFSQSIDQSQSQSTNSQYNKILQKYPTNGKIRLDCGHQWEETELYYFFSNELQSKCFCQQRYSVQIFNTKNQNQNNNNYQFDYIYQKQLLRIVETMKLQVEFCKNNCGFFFVFDNNLRMYDSLCNNCDFCIVCRTQLFSNVIIMGECNHRLHILCAYQQINPNCLQNSKCICGCYMDNNTKLKLNIMCIICEKYDNELDQMDCQHYIHTDCFKNNLNKFISFQCYLCEISIVDYLSQYKMSSIHKDLKQKNQENYLENCCLICHSETEETLIRTKCSHKIHKSCWEKKENELRNSQDQVIICHCGLQI